MDKPTYSLCPPAAAMRGPRRQLFGREAMALLLLVALICAFFWPLVVGGYWLPWGGGDLASFLWPTWRFAARSLRQGVVPLWNPTLYAGAPFAADPQSALFYPPNLVVYALGGEPSYAIMQALVIGHMILAAVAMYAFVRQQGLSRPAAVLGGLAFALSDLFVTHIGNLNLNATIAYLPLILALADQAFARRSVRWAAAAGAALAVAALAGHAQMLLLIGLALGMLVLWRMAGAWRMRARDGVKVLVLAVLIGAWGLGGAAIALCPAYELSAHTTRAALSWQEASRYSLPWEALVGWIAPGFYGRGPVSFWGQWDRVEVGYLGILPLALAAAALADGWGKGRCRSLFFALLALIGLVLAWGENAPLYRLLHNLPVLRGMRAPARAVVLADMGVAMLAAHGLERIRASRRGQMAALAVLLLAALVALILDKAINVPPAHLATAQRALRLSAIFAAAGIAWVLAMRRGAGGRWWAASAVALLAAELILSGSLVEVERKDPTHGFGHGAVVARLRADPNLYRIDSSAARAWAPDAAAVHGLYDIGGIPNPLNLQSYETYRWSIGARGDKLYNLLGVKYVLADKGVPPGDATLIPVDTSDPEIDIYLNSAAYPMAQLIYETRRVSDHAAALAALHEPGFDPTRAIVLEQEPLPVSRPPADQPPALGFTRYEANELALQVSTATPAYLLLSEVYYPGWRATLDGQEAEIWRADYLFRAIYVPSGAHEVRLWFSPTSFWVGLAVSVVSWTSLLLILSRVYILHSLWYHVIRHQ